MPAQLSKLHVRYIQTQKNFFLLKDKDTQGQKLPLSQLYVKDNAHFYLIIHTDPIQEGQEVSIMFNEPTPALKSLRCKVHVQQIQASSEEYEDALLFFHADTTTLKQVLLLSIDTLSDN